MLSRVKEGAKRASAHGLPEHGRSPSKDHRIPESLLRSRFFSRRPLSKTLTRSLLQLPSTPLPRRFSQHLPSTPSYPLAPRLGLGLGFCLTPFFFFSFSSSQDATRLIKQSDKYSQIGEILLPLLRSLQSFRIGRFVDAYTAFDKSAKYPPPSLSSYSWIKISFCLFLDYRSVW